MSGLEAEARARQVHLESQLDEALPDVRCAPEHLQRVLLNLVTNALRHTPSDGSVFVRARRHTGELEVSVEDTGVGLSSEAQQRMFERFWREDTSRTRASGGAGLGLAIARGFVEAQGGRIWAENRPEGGARFAFTLPLAEPRAQRPADEQPAGRTRVFRECSSSCKSHVRSGRHRAGGRGMTPARHRRFHHEATSPRHPARARPRRSGGLIRQCLCSARLLRPPPTHRTPTPEHESLVVGHAYVNDNTARRTPWPALTGTPTARSPRSPAPRFPTGGAGSGAGLASQGAIQLSSDGRYLLAVDAASNQISVLRTRLRRRSAAGRRARVLRRQRPRQHRGLGQSRVRRQRRRQRTQCHGLPPGPLAVSCTRCRARPSRCPPARVPTTCCSIPPARGWSSRSSTPRRSRAFTSASQAACVAAPGSPFAAQGPGPFGSEFRPTNPSQLFVSNAHGGEGNGTVSAFNVSFSGELTSIGASPFADLQTAPCWVEISHDGQFLFTVNTGSGEISSYAINPDGSLRCSGARRSAQPERAPLTPVCPPTAGRCW